MNYYEKNTLFSLCVCVCVCVCVFWLGGLGKGGKYMGERALDEGFRVSGVRDHMDPINALPMFSSSPSSLFILFAFLFYFYFLYREYLFYFNKVLL